MRSSMPAFWFLPPKAIAFTALTALLVACGSDDGGAGGKTPNGDVPAIEDPANQPPGSNDPSIAEQLAEKPWEVVSNKGETYLPNVFYADASQNEQIMPWAIDGHVMIDRLVYPTLGNPNLYTKSDPSDQFMTVLRIEDEAYAHLGLQPEALAGSSLTRLPIKNDAATGFAFFLVPRAARENNTEATQPISSGNGTGVFRVYPNEVLVNPIPADMPESLKARKTLRFVFKQAAMQRVPAGLYDVRMEVRKDNELYKPTGNAVGVYEYQYNAVRVFDTEPDEYKVINVTDTQVSVGDLYGAKTKDKLDELVQYLNTTSDANVRGASFITFNGDLHNGGSPGSLRQRPVAWTYNDEAKAIVNALKYLPVPIFLTAGNHDGYVSTGHVPSAVKALDTGLFDSLPEIIDEANPKAWPGFAITKFQSYLAKTEAADQLGGIHTDIFTGAFSRNPKGTTFGDGWKEVPRDDRNFILYDGFHQWQKTYGPTHFSWKFGKSFYVSLNSFELRQHRRSGWGMYTVNYGGAMSGVQMAWLDRELLRTKVTGDDVVLLAHHDPRGGHDNLDPGYYFEQLEYRSVYQSAINYLVGKVWNSAVCKLPPWALTRDQSESCVHDGLQEWMRPDDEFDCAWDERKDGVCDKAQFDPTSGTKQRFMSGFELIKRVAQNPQVRTMLLGHTHYNQLEVLQNGDQVLPGSLPVDAAAAQMFATLEVQNPVRGYSFLQQEKGAAAEYDIANLPMFVVTQKNERFTAMMNKFLPNAPRTLEGPLPGRPRELVIMRLVSASDLANQTYNGDSAMGFGVLHLTKKADERAYGNAQINKTTFFVNRGSNVFTKVATVDLDRNARLKPHDPANPIQKFYVW
jgi:hypothetical protein